MEEISAQILAKIRDVAQEAIEEEVDQAVITVPAYFNDRQRQAVRKAGRLADLKVLRIVNEPTAAALANPITAAAVAAIVTAIVTATVTAIVTAIVAPIAF